MYLWYTKSILMCTSPEVFTSVLYLHKVIDFIKYNTGTQHCKTCKNREFRMDGGDD